MIEPRFAECIKTDSKPSNFCPGCGHSIVLKNIGQVISELNIAKKVIFTTDIGCSLLSWDYFNLNSFQSHHGRATSCAVGIKRGRPEATVIAYMGDGGGYAIGLQNLIHACYRNEPLTVIVVNNTIYSMTGGQMAPTTLPQEVTDSSPSGDFTQKRPFFGPELLAQVAHPGSYLARASVANPSQLALILKKAIENQTKRQNFSFVEVLSYCPTNWKTNARDTISFLEKMKLAFPTGELTK